MKKKRRKKKDALNRQPVFTCLFHVWDKAAEIIEDIWVSRATQEAVVIGWGYPYVGEKRHFSKCIHTLKGQIQILQRRQVCLGSTLCVEKPSDKNVKALIFPQKLLETDYKFRSLLEMIESSQMSMDIWSRGWFVLPTEIRDGEIHRGGEPTEEDSDSKLDLAILCAPDMLGGNKRRDF